MNLFTTIRQRQALRARHVLGLFAVVWLNMALQPCAMAFGDKNDDGCPYCPPALSVDMSSHSSHDADHSDPGGSPCEIDVSQCALVDNFNYDGRAVKIKDTPSDVQVGIAPRIFGISLADNSPVLLDSSDHSYLPGGSPPLNTLYCVYLI